MQNTNFGIVKTFNENDFINEFNAHNRMDNFSNQGLRVLFESLKQTAIDCEVNIEMNVIALRWKYSEDTLADIIDKYDIDVSECTDVEDFTETVEEYLQENTFVCGSYADDEHYKVFIYQVF